MNKELKFIIKGKVAVFIDAAKELIQTADDYVDLRKIRKLIERKP